MSKQHKVLIAVRGSIIITKIAMKLGLSRPFREFRLLSLSHETISNCAVM